MVSSVINVAEAHMGVKGPFVNGFRDLDAKRQGFADICDGNTRGVRSTHIDKDVLR